MKQLLEHLTILSLTRRSDFNKAHGGIRVGDDFVQIRVNIAPELKEKEKSIENRLIRLGIVVPKKYGNAVLRNRFKRIVRVAVRNVVQKNDFSGDIVVLPRESKGITSAELTESLENIFLRLKRKIDQMNG